MDTVGTRLKISRIKANLQQDEVVDNNTKYTNVSMVYFGFQNFTI